ncbi:MAG: hypothetical protein AW11_01198 [Candidatus Accumulibacter regalis]|jgi:hypothetical protein|uniref:Uncharacterized protein n=1 Tax=Accumulibacter regalis TaxID=522306 RepID=A0A011QKP1_ACCRE|nr:MULTISPECIES: hypothetical protein [unclassified Candidatus Accumulibacter]EXI89922.1 MAG: hypothetical protein AW11_01198 [Candidatus Accumulibacter regalis]MBL8367218.1 hypothetical protein [Accumulibacter sp.]MBN8513404.1 hypothetical protein [Accumulibacter sp.]HRE72554.1 hypothetical protein [Accumulibacter sp.]
MKWLLALALLAAAAPLSAGEAISVCYNYGCLSQSDVHYADEQLAQIQALLGTAESAADERAKLSLAMGWLLGWAGQQTPIAADRGGNTADNGVYGRMDCIDHSTTGTRLLRLLEARGWLRFHRVLDPVWRVLYLFQVHHAAQIEEVAATVGSESGTNAAQAASAGGGGGAAEPARYVVDSWFRDNGQPALVIDLQSWLDGREENLEP